jgi:hypothetical protein
VSANIVNIYLDVAIGILEFIILFVFFLKTEKYSSFNFIYYYYLIVAPCYGLMKFFKIIQSPKLNIDPTQMDSSGTVNTQSPIDKKSQVLQLFQILFGSLLIISPTLVELISGILSTIVKYTATKNISNYDMYIVHFIPALLGIVILCLKEINTTHLSNRSDGLSKPYILFAIMLDVSGGIALNTLILISGSLIGLSICNSLG